MARLLHRASGREHEVEARCVVGRSPPCTLLLDRPLVSGVHAELVWDGEGWVLHDLDSSNGTFVAGRRLAAGERTRLAEGSELAFGDREQVLVLIDASPPRLVAKAGERTVVAEDGLLCLPGEDDPELTVMLDDQGRWVVESSDAVRPIADYDVVVAGELAWSVHLPQVVHGTRAVVDEVLTLQTIALELTVSRDEEHVSCCMRHDGHEVELVSRAHAFLLLHLARARMADAEQGLGPAEQGWRHRDEMCQQLGIDNQLLNLWVYRARRQLVQAGVVDATRVIERRAGSQQLRLGVARVEVIQSEGLTP